MRYLFALCLFLTGCANSGYNSSYIISDVGNQERVATEAFEEQVR